jgi:hypothetical protein
MTRKSPPSNSTTSRLTERIVPFLLGMILVAMLAWVWSNQLRSRNADLERHKALPNNSLLPNNSEGCPTIPCFA